MKTTKWLGIAIVVVAGLTLATVYKSRPRPAQVAAPLEQPVAAAPAAQPAISSVPEPAPEVSPGETPATVPGAELPAMSMVAVDGDIILATVNGAPIRLADLMPIHASGTPSSLRADVYADLLNRAIDRELTMQTATARGLELSAPQKQEVEQIRTEALARANAPYILPGYDAEAQAAFEVRDWTAQLLQNIMLAKTGQPAHYVTSEQIQTYYAEHPAEFDKLPKDPAKRDQAWLAIEADIRNRLARDVYIQNEQERRELLLGLRAGAAVEILISPLDEAVRSEPLPDTPR